ncbi:hypothetical protein [Acuticoccus sediminis]|uniref:hypothetical protein n=1 Tax=Acuticoccus sediminis TaxID=2184697 RepID=UPI001391523B|nr:hypothetical protein [Acuticoccus sediminis]
MAMALPLAPHSRGAFWLDVDRGAAVARTFGVMNESIKHAAPETSRDRWSRFVDAAPARP